MIKYLLDKYKKHKNIIESRLMKLAKNGKLGKRAKITAYIGKPDKTERKDRRNWKKRAKDLQKEYRGVKLWYNSGGSRIGEYISLCIPLLRVFAESTDDYLDVMVDVFSHDSNVAVRSAFGRHINIISHENRREWKYILCGFADIDYTKCDKPYSRGEDLHKYSYNECSGLLDMNPDEMELCKNKLSDALLESTYVCVFNRDGAYLDTINSIRDFSYHDYRDSDIEDRNLMANYLIDCGIQLIRMGKVVEHRWTREGVWDYASGHYDDWLDLFLHQKAKFCVEDSSGINCIPFINNGHIVITNLCPLLVPWCGIPLDMDAIYIFKKEWSEDKKRFLSLREMVDIDLKAHYDGHKYSLMNVRMIDNSPEEIRDATIEMNERIDGNWIETDDDRRRQRIFEEAFDEIKKEYGMQDIPIPRFRIGARFLEQNWDIFDLEAR